MKKNKGITLIALVITIIVLLILAGVTINAIIGNESAMEKAKEARTENDIANAKDAAILRATTYIQEYMEKRYVQNDSNVQSMETGDYVAQEIHNKTEGDFTFTVSDRVLTVKKANTNIVSGNIENNGSITWIDVDNSGNSGNTHDNGDDSSKTRTVTVTSFASLNTDAQLPSDKNTIVQKGTGETQQQIVIPAGFKIASDSGTTLESGMVIEDATEGNQFVWIPVNQIVTFANGTTGQIELGRYSFNGSNTPNYTREVKQDGTDDGSTIIYDSYEDVYSGEGIETRFTETEINSKAINISHFKSKTNNAKGYYIGRYEAGIENGVYDTTNKVWNKVDSTKDIKTVCKKEAVVYNFIPIGDNTSGVIKEARGMYNNTAYISDLINSYAWDTAIVFIESCTSNSLYNFQDSESSISTNAPQLTGTNYLTNDELDLQCNIYDMAGNVLEMTTEYCESDEKEWESIRGGGYMGDIVNAQNGFRHNAKIGVKSKSTGFRPILYILETN